jgi:hypothetical protein
MKRLINAYGIESALQLLQAEEVGGDRLRMEQLVLWTILMLRWPLLADYLGDRPEDVEAIFRGEKPKHVPDELAPLFEDSEVRQVVMGTAKGVDAVLDVEAVRIYAGLSEAESPALRQASLTSSVPESHRRRCAAWSVSL